MRIPDIRSVKSASYRKDGGTTHLRVSDAHFVRHRITLTRKLADRRDSKGRVPGRLYFDDDIVPPRSQLEAELIVKLQHPRIRPGLAAWAQWLLTEKRTPRIGQTRPERMDLYCRSLDGPSESIKSSVDRVIDYVQSHGYTRSVRRNDDT